MDRAMSALSDKYEYISFSYCIKGTGAPVIVTDANPDEAHAIGGVEIIECTTFLGECQPSESKGLDMHSIGYGCKSSRPN